jgi:hypothetical protein
MDLLERAEARALLADTDLSAAAVRSCADRLEAFLQRYLPLFRREEQRQHARTVLCGKLSGLQRKTTQPSATQAGQKRRPLQLFVGAGAWDDDLEVPSEVQVRTPVQSLGSDREIAA